MSADVKVTATPARPEISDRLTVRGPLSYTAWPGSPFLELREGEELFSLIEHSEKPMVPPKVHATMKPEYTALEDLERRRVGHVLHMSRTH